MSYTLGVIIGNANSSHTTDTMRGIKAAAEKTGCNIMSFVGVRSSYFYREYFNTETAVDYDYQSVCVYDYDELCKIDAYIVSFGTLSVFLSEKEIRDIQKKIFGKPTIYIESPVDNTSAKYIMTDNYSGMSSVMEHLIKYHGYKKILYLSGPRGNVDAEERLKAYKDAMEKAWISIDSSMIEYGDFSETVDDKVNALLDMNPDAEALVCANDLMAETAYKVLAERKELYKEAVRNGEEHLARRYYKHEVGGEGAHAIAITGYDNIPDSSIFDPPLTTVEQSPYSHGYLSVLSAIKLIETPEKATSITSKPQNIIRKSCGCKSGGRIDFPKVDDRYRVSPEHYAAQTAQIFVDNIVPNEIVDEISDEVYSEIYNILLRNAKDYLGISGQKISSENLLLDIKKFLNGSITKYVSRNTFFTAFEDYMVEILGNAEAGKDKDILIDAKAKINEYIYSLLFYEAKEARELYNQRTWFMPLISRDMVNHLDSLKDMYLNAIHKLKVLNLGNVYLFMLREPVRHLKGEKWKCPDELLLVAYSKVGECEDDNILYACEPDEAKVVTKDKLMNAYLGTEWDRFNASMINLYSGEYQYGVIVAETVPDDVLSLNYAAVQISTALKYCEMARAQNKLQAQMAQIIQEVEEKNEMLRSLSEYDQLTGCYNRRGFMEKASTLISENNGKTAVVIFADLDHLKEINDKFGHKEGDFAIEHAYKNIKASLPDAAIISRLGGDEFVAAYLVDCGISAEDVKRNFNSVSINFNAMSEKPYYVECSLGCFEFSCSSETGLEDIIGRADELLYEAKAKRRNSIVKRKNNY